MTEFALCCRSRFAGFSRCRETGRFPSPPVPILGARVPDAGLHAHSLFSRIELVGL